MFLSKHEILFFTHYESDGKAAARKRLFKKWIQEIKFECDTSFCTTLEIENGFVLVSTSISKSDRKMIELELKELLI